MASDDLCEVLVFGRSHLRAVRLAWNARTEAGRTEGLELRFIQLLSRDWQPSVVEGRYNEKILAELARPNLRLIVSVVGGNEHNVLGLVNHPTRFDFVLPEAPDLPLQEGAAILPSLLVRKSLERRIAPTVRLIRLLRRSTRLPIVQLDSPPPIPSAEHIARYPIGFEELVPELGVAPALLRYKLWRLRSEIAREACESMGIRVVPVPKPMQDPHGMLVRDAWADDATHANAFYGERLCRQILAIVERRRAIEA